MIWAREATFTEVLGIIIFVCLVAGLIKFAISIEDLPGIFPAGSGNEGTS
jgi:hypothetical protein